MLSATDFFFLEAKTLLITLIPAMFYFFILKKVIKSREQKMLMLLLSGIILRTLSMFFIPAFEAPDEYSHYQYIEKITKSWELPVLKNKTGDAEGGWEYHQPPLYYAFSALLLKTFSLEALPNKLTMIILRFVSLLYFIISAILVIRILDFVTEEESIKVICFSFFCFLPSFIFISTAVNNDSLIYLLSIAFLYYSLQNLTVQRQIRLSVILALAFYTKSSALVLIIWNFILLVSEITYIRKNRAEQEHVFILSTVILLLTLLLWFPWLYRNIVLYKTAFPVSLASEKTVWKGMGEFIYHFIFEVAETFISAGGKYNNIRFFPYIGMMTFMTGYISFFISPISYLEIDKRKFMAITIPLIINIFLLLNFAYLYNQCQGRFLYIFLLPLLYAAADGLYKLSHKKEYEENFILMFLMIYGTGSVLNILFLRTYL